MDEMVYTRGVTVSALRQMKFLTTPIRLIWACGVSLLLFSMLHAEAQPMLPTGRVRWHGEEKKVDADIRGMSLERILSQLARVSGWKVLLQPGSDRPVYARFRNTERGEALRLILGDLNYALLPQNGGGSELRVYKTSMSEATIIIKGNHPEKSKDWLSREVIVSLADRKSVV